jgi:hypothetical protein
VGAEDFCKKLGLEPLSVLRTEVGAGWARPREGSRVPRVRLIAVVQAALRRARRAASPQALMASKPAL